MHAEPTRSLEIERKYEPAESAQLPGAAAFEPLGYTLAVPYSYQLQASYFDTPGADLAALRVAVRSRTGGSDSGWHLKEKNEHGALELQWPAAPEMPEGLRQELIKRIGADSAGRLGAIAVISTNRTLTEVMQGTQVVAELCDDEVEAQNARSGSHQRWREWEVELVAEQISVLDEIEPLLLAVGAKRVRGTSKIQRTMSV